MTILRTDKIAGTGSANAITGSVFFGNGVGSTTARDNIVTGPSSDFTFGTGDFTLEGWFYLNHINDQWVVLIADTLYASSGGWSFYTLNGTLYFWKAGSAVLTGGTVTANTWHHIAYSRQSGVNRIFVDGAVANTNNSDSTDYTDNEISVGANNVDKNGALGAYGLNGYASNVRVIKGKAEYTAAFTPPTRELEVTPETVLLCCQSSQDAGQNAKGTFISVRGNAEPSTFVPDVGNDHTYGMVLEDNVEFPSLNYMTLPRGTTTQSNRGVGLLMGNNSSAADGMKYFSLISSGNTTLFGELTTNDAINGGAGASSTRGVIGGGSGSGGDVNIMEYVTIATTSNALDFGDLTQARRDTGVVGSDTRGCWCGGGYPTSFNIIDYITFASTGNATNFGDLTQARRAAAGGCSSGTRGLVAGGYGGGTPNIIEYITIASTGDATDFGDLTVNRTSLAGTSSPTRAVWGCGAEGGSNVYNTIDYVTIASLGNATDFGDLITAMYNSVGACGSHIRGMWIGGYDDSNYINSIQYITIATTGNAKDWGDLIAGNDNERSGDQGATSDCHGGLS